MAKFTSIPVAKFSDVAQAACEAYWEARRARLDSELAARERATLKDAMELIEAEVGSGFIVALNYPGKIGVTPGERKAVKPKADKAGSLGDYLDKAKANGLAV